MRQTLSRTLLRKIYISRAINRDCSRKLDNTVKSNARVNSASQGLLGCCLLWLAASRNTSGVRLWQAITGVASRDQALYRLSSYLKTTDNRWWCYGWCGWLIRDLTLRVQWRYCCTRRRPVVFGRVNVAWLLTLTSTSFSVRITTQGSLLLNCISHSSDIRNSAQRIYASCMSDRPVRR